MRRLQVVAACLAVLLVALSGETTADAQGTLAQAPKLLSLVEPELPPGTSFPAPELEVLLEIQVSRTGTVTASSVLQGVGEPFDAAARAAASRFVFEPGRLDTGEAVPVTVRFRLRMVEPPAPPPSAVETSTRAKVQDPPATLAGTLLERGTRRPIAYAEISARKGERLVGDTLSDESGRFSLTVESGKLRVLIVPAVHESSSEEVEINPGSTLELRKYLERIDEGYETIVRGTADRREVSRQEIDVETVRLVAGTQGDTIKVIQNLPGVARASFGGGPLVLRGAAPGDSRTFIEGQQIPQLYHFGGLRSSVSSSFLEKVEFVPGNFAPDYGRATGGIIDVRLRDPSDDLFRGEVDLNFYDAGFTVEGPVSDEVALGAAFRRSWIDVLLPAFIPEDSDVGFDTAPRFYDYQFLGTWKAAPKHTLRAVYYGSLDRLELLFDKPASDPALRGTLSTRVMYHQLLLESEAKLSGSVDQNLSLQTGVQELGFELGPEFFFDLAVFDVSIRGTWTYRHSKEVSLRAGIDSTIGYVDISLSSPEPPKEGENPIPASSVERFSAEQKEEIFEPAAFVELSYKPTEELTFLPSLRADYYGAIRRMTLDPRLTMSYALMPETLLSAGLGLYQQPPQPDESARDVGNPDLLPERSLQTSLGVRHKIRDAVSIELTGFYKWLDRLVVRNLERSLTNAAPLYTNEGVGRVLGLEALLRYDFDRNLFGWIAYTFQRSFRTDRPGEDERLFDFDQPHLLTAVATWEIGAGWSLGARFRLASGNPYTPVVGSIFDAYRDVYVPLYDSEAKDRLELFHQLDVRIDKTWTFDEWKLSAYLDVQNVYNRQNPEGLQFSYDYSESKPVSGLPVLPLLGIKGSW